MGQILSMSNEAILHLVGWVTGVGFAVAIAWGLASAYCLGSQGQPGWRPPIHSVRDVPTLPLDESGRLIDLARGTQQVYRGDGMSGYYEEVPSACSWVRLEATRQLFPLGTHVVFLEDVTTLQVVERRWPKWWQRWLGYPPDVGGNVSFRAPKSWLAQLEEAPA